MSDDVIKDTYSLALSRSERVLVQLMHERGSLDRDEMIDALYHAGRNPARPDDALRAAVYQLRNKLSWAGWTISNNKGGRGKVAVYSLERLDGGHASDTRTSALQISGKRADEVWGETLPVLPQRHGGGEDEA